MVCGFFVKNVKKRESKLGHSYISIVSIKLTGNKFFYGFINTIWSMSIVSLTN